MSGHGSAIRTVVEIASDRCVDTSLLVARFLDTLPLTSVANLEGPLSGLELIARLVEALAWPIAFVAVAILFRERMKEVIGALATRVASLTKVNAFGAGIEFDAPATEAVEKVLSDDETPLAMREVLATAIREELDRIQKRTPAPAPPLHRGQEALSLQANAVLFEAEVLRALERSTPRGARVVTRAVVQGREFDALILPESAENGDTSGAVVVEVAVRASTEKLERDLRRAASLRPAGLIYVVANQSKQLNKIRNDFETFARRDGVVNAYLVVFDPAKETSFSALEGAVHDALRGSRV